MDFLEADRERAFADWGVAVIYRRVQAAYDPQTQQATETHSDTPATAIVGPAPARAGTGTAGQYAAEGITFLVRTADLPAGAPSLVDRLVWNGGEYEIASFTASADGTAVLLECRRR